MLSNKWEFRYDIITLFKDEKFVIHFLAPENADFVLLSFLLIPPFFGLAKNRRYSETAVLGGSIYTITLKNPI